MKREVKEEKDGNLMVRSEACKQSKNSIKRHYVVAKPTLENYDGRANDNLKQDFLREHLKHYQSN